MDSNFPKIARIHQISGLIVAGHEGRCPIPAASIALILLIKANISPYFSFIGSVEYNLTIQVMSSYNQQNPYDTSGGANPFTQQQRQWDYRDINAPAIAPGKVANAFMARIFTIMSLGLAITGLASWLFAAKYLVDANGAMEFYSSPIHWVVMFAPLAFILVLSFGIQRLSYPVATVVFIAFAVTMGLSLSSIFFIYNMSTIFQVFFMTAGTFGAMALIGSYTSVDLTKFGSILLFALIGLMISMIVNAFLQSPFMHYLIGGAGVVIFAGLTAYDTQRFRRMAYQVEAGSESANKLALMGALSLYMDFINLFLFLLRLFGGGRD